MIRLKRVTKELRRLKKLLQIQQKAGLASARKRQTAVGTVVDSRLQPRKVKKRKIKKKKLKKRKLIALFLLRPRFGKNTAGGLTPRHPAANYFPQDNFASLFLTVCCKCGLVAACRRGEGCPAARRRFRRVNFENSNGTYLDFGKD